MTVHNEEDDDFTSVPILIYVPGLGVSQRNTADAVATVIAESLDRQSQGHTYNTRTSKKAVAPRGLAVGKTVVDDQNKPVLQLFQFTYKAELEPSTTEATPPVVPGMLRASTFAVFGVVKLFRALCRPAKTACTKAQLLLGFFACFSLIFWAAVSVYALLVALGLDLPFEGIFGTTDQAATWTFGVTALGLTITWTALRRKILAAAAITERLICFVRNEDRVADSITMKLDGAIDQLRDNSWKGPIHLLGYSFGSLVVFEAMNARVTSRLAPQPAKAVASMVTIGCPLDLVRLYQPSYVEGRTARNPKLPWKNVFNAADIFASNLQDGNDKSPGKCSLKLDSVAPESMQYLDEKIGLFQIFTSGHAHTAYWDNADRASCFDGISPGWISKPIPAQRSASPEAVSPSARTSDAEPRSRTSPKPSARASSAAQQTTAPLLPTPPGRRTGAAHPAGRR